MQNSIEIKRLTESDALFFAELVRLFCAVFETPHALFPDTSYLKSLLQKPDFVAYVILHDNELVGGLTGYELSKYYTEESELFIYDIAIKPAFQRNGFGRQLLSTLVQHCRRHNIGELFVAAHADDADALSFYKATGGRAEEVVHFNYTASDP